MSLRPEPRAAVIRLTNACNAKCKFCGIWREENISQLDNAWLDKLPKSLKNITLSGGEPFLRSDLPEIIERITSVCDKSRIVIATNGILTDRITEQMRKIIKIYPGIAVRLSMDAIGELHDNIRGIKDAFACVTDTLKSLKQLKVRDLGIAITVSDINISEITGVYGVARKEKVRFNCQVAHNSDFYYRSNNSEINQKDLLKEQLNSIILCDLKSFTPQRLFKAYYYRGLWNYTNRLPRIYPCNAGSLFFYLGNNGNIYPCIFLGIEMGNLQNRSFDDIWSGSLAYRAREDVKRCNLNCWVTCTAAPEIKSRPFRAAKWVFMNKIKAHLGKPDFI